MTVHHSPESVGLSRVDLPNSYIGRSVPRPSTKRLVEGRASYTGDVALPRLVHAVFVRSPHAHARIKRIDTSRAAKSPGVIRIFTGRDLAEVCDPWVATLAHLKGMKSAPQYPLPLERATWQGEAVVGIVADSVAHGEDAIALVEIDWEELPPQVDMETALEPGAPVIHPELGDNLVFTRTALAGSVDEAFAKADRVIEATFHTGRHTGVTLEPRSIVADYNRADGTLTVHHSTQAPHMMQSVFATQLRMAESDVRVICKDVGGSFGIKVHVYPDEVAAVCMAKILGRPVKFVADRLESFSSDIHARDHRLKGRIAVMNDGRIVGFDIDDLTGIGPYSVYPRTSAVEGNQVVNLCGGPYAFEHYRCTTRVVLQNKTPTCQYRAVGHPIATTVTEGLVDLAAEAIGMDPITIRQRNLIPDDAYPCVSPSGMKFEGLSHHKALETLVAMVKPEEKRREQEALRQKGIYRGLGFASFIELTNPSPFMYGLGGARIAAQDGCTVRMDPDGSVVALSGVTEQGQGTEAILAQIVAHGVGVPVAKVKVVTGDTRTTPYGGGTWACRGAGIGGEAALQSALALREQLIAVAASILQADPSTLDVAMGEVVDRTPASRACRSRSSVASSISVATRCRRTRRASSCRRATSSPRNSPSPSPTASRRAGWRSMWRPASSSCSTIGSSRIAGGSSTLCSSTSRCGAAWCRDSAARSTSIASTTRRASSGLPRWPTIWCRSRPRCRTSMSAMSKRRQRSRCSAPRARARPAPLVRRPP